MDALTDGEIAILDAILWDEMDRNFHEPSCVSAEDSSLIDSLAGKVRDEAKKRKLWWAR